MFNYLNRAYEPRSLLIVRLSILLALFVILVIAAIERFGKVLVGQSTWKNRRVIRPIPIPPYVIRMKTDPDNVNYKSSLSRTEFSNDTLRTVSDDDTSWYSLLVWGENVTDSVWVADNGQDDISKSSYMHLLVKSKNAVFSATPEELRLEADAADEKSHAAILRKEELDSGTTFVTQVVLTRTMVNDSTDRQDDDAAPVFYFLTDYAEHGVNPDDDLLLDLSSVSESCRIKGAWGADSSIYIEMSQKMHGNDIETDFHIHARHLPSGNMSQLSVTIMSANRPYSKGLYEVPIYESYKSYNIFSSFRDLGGLFALLGLAYTILLGSSRIRPWGLIQWVYRRRILSQLDPAIAHIYKSHTTVNLNKTEHIIVPPGQHVPRRPRPKQPKTSVQLKREKEYEIALKKYDKSVARLRELLSRPNHNPRELQEALDSMRNTRMPLDQTYINMNHYGGFDDVSSIMMADGPSDRAGMILTSLSECLDRIEIQQQQMMRFRMEQEAFRRRQAKFRERQIAFQLRTDMFYISPSLFLNCEIEPPSHATSEQGDHDPAKNTV
jgi:hypothetical protein